MALSSSGRVWVEEKGVFSAIWLQSLFAQACAGLMVPVHNRSPEEL